MFATCQAGYEDLLVAELAEKGYVSVEHGPGWAWSRNPEGSEGVVATGFGDLVFPHWIFPTVKEIKGESVNALAQQLADAFFEALRGERIEAPWPCLFHCPAEIVGLGRRVAGVEKAFNELIRKRLSRVAKLAVPEVPRQVGLTRGWAVFFTDFGRAVASREIWNHGPRRMADDERAPSRSYLKVEEAYLAFGREPQAGETVVDLGAAPGGWSFSAAKRGARVLALDNGPLKGGALGHPQIEHRRVDAFAFEPEAGTVYDWLFCDLVEDPHHVMENVVGPWLARKWCRYFVINLKFGRVSPLAFLKEIRASDGVLTRHAPGFKVRHLYHDREEFTVMGEVTT
ncbi:MAG TPA: SAM-dependent methyltransferase [Opitutaceae bacterium]|nr:SAM-dependent methyltransferase [Opitutaceae bacterium]